jgi:DNA-binding GntR family transcriptional regulator
LSIVDPPPLGSPPQRPPFVSRAAEIVDALEESILRGERRPGDRLDERQLAEQFGVSRTPIREAIQRLMASGLVSVRGRSGAAVAELSAADLLDAFSVVADLEALAAALAARRSTADEQARLAALHEDCAATAAAGDVQAFFLANNAFHQEIAEASHNRVLQEQLRTVTLKTAPYRHYVTYRPGRMLSSIPEHAEILAAIIAGDTTRASTLMRTHVALLGEDVTDFLHAVHRRSA